MQSFAPFNIQHSEFSIKKLFTKKKNLQYMNTDKRRVVITGMGAVSPIGNDLPTIWDNLMKGYCGIDFIKSFDASDLPVKIAAELKDFDPEACGVEKAFVKRNDRFAVYTLAAAYQAMTATMLESARKGYWKPSDAQLQQTARLHADITRENGAACTDFVCNNAPLQEFIAGNLPSDVRQGYNRQMSLVKNGQTSGKATVLERQESGVSHQEAADHTPIWLTIIILTLLVGIIIYLRMRNGNRR